MLCNEPMDRALPVVIVAAVVTAVASVAAIAAAITSDDDTAGGAVVTPAASTPAATDAVAVEIRDFAFGPPEATVAPGTEVRWTNADGVDHSVVAEDGTFASPNLDEGATFPFTFTEPGTYAYFCGIHDSMRGTVVVEG